MQTVEYSRWRERHAGLLREAENERLARRLRMDDRREGARGFWKRLGAWAGLAPRRPAHQATGIEVRWCTSRDEGRIGELLDLNGAPRGVATGEGFVVAERGGEVQAAVRYRTEPKRLLLGLLVANPWVEERPLAEALYAGARELAREMGAREIRARCGHAASYASRAGYRRGKARVRAEAAR